VSVVRSVYWFIDLLACWFNSFKGVGAIASLSISSQKNRVRKTRSLVCWLYGLLNYRLTGLLVIRFTKLLDCWFTGLLSPVCLARCFLIYQFTGYTVYCLNVIGTIASLCFQTKIQGDHCWFSVLLVNQLLVRLVVYLLGCQFFTLPAYLFTVLTVIQITSLLIVRITGFRLTTTIVFLIH
jgi:hypothetical protein